MSFFWVDLVPEKHLFWGPKTPKKVGNPGFLAPKSADLGAKTPQNEGPESPFWEAKRQNLRILGVLGGQYRTPIWPSRDGPRPGFDDFVKIVKIPKVNVNIHVFLEI